MKSSWQEVLSQLGNNKTQCHEITVAISEQSIIAEYIKSNQGILITEWVAYDQSTHETYWYVLYVYQSSWICVQSKLHPKRPVLDDLSIFFPVANRLQRAIYDLTKISTKKVKDKRPWLSQGHFRIGLLNPYSQSNRYAKISYPFQQVSGNGVHEVPVGPVHAGIIEPGHFRFSVVGERILKLEERLGYTHKGIHRLLMGKNLKEASQCIARVSGDSTVAYSYAFALACEHHLGIQIPTHTAVMRAVLLERERLVNHIGDIGAIINDTGFASLAAQFSILKEILVRENAILTGHRYMMDIIMPNQIISTWDSNTIRHLSAQLDNIFSELSTLQNICQKHPGLQDRLQTTGIISKETAQSLGLLGITGRASNMTFDARSSHFYSPYQEIDFIPITEMAGDVAARVQIRFQEAKQSISIIKNLLVSLQQPDMGNSRETAAQSNFGIGFVEGWRGPICVAVKLNHHHQILWCHFHDPSWQNWLALEYAVMDNIIADFPLINKSFNLSYSGQDS